MPRSRFVRLTLPVVVAATTLIGLASAPAQDGGMSDVLRGFFNGGSEQPGEPARRVPFSAAEVQLSFAPLVQQTAPTVVNVYAERMTRQRTSPFEGDPFFEQFFGRAFRQAPPRVQSSLGSGVIVGADGVVVTNFHVIEGADQVRIALSDGREYDSRLMLADKELDLAVLKINPGTELAALPLADSDLIAIGDLVLAIGNPFGVGQTTTSGIISATARSRIGVSDFGFFIQTDAAINPGNSGGALINMGGELIGINTAIFSRGGGSNGIGFAIPSNMVRAVVAQAVAGSSRFERPWIGAEFDAVTPEIADALGMERPFGAIVTGVARDGPAAKAGLKPGDVIVAVNAVEIEHPDALGYRLLVHQAGEAVAMTVRRQARDSEVRVMLARQPKAGEGAQGRIIIEGESPFAGAVLARDRGPGVPIIDLVEGSTAARTGFRPGDRIVALNGEEVATPQDVQRLAAENTRWWRFTIDRDGAIINQVLRF
ncbi:MAG: Do family serine endopeptidase [Rhizobiaceae bacterium]|jgi:Do/DeqQ family serine protease|nr:Do family serine endopeptidase [Rhizobiaceae bacterium]